MLKEEINNFRNSLFAQYCYCAARKHHTTVIWLYNNIYKETSSFKEFINLLHMKINHIN